MTEIDYNEQYWRNRGGEGPSPWATPEEQSNYTPRVNDYPGEYPRPSQDIPIRAPGSPLDTQVAGSHYKNCAIQPVEYIYANNMGYIEGAVVKYITRYESKGGEADLDKIIHFVQILKELRYAK